MPWISLSDDAGALLRRLLRPIDWLVSPEWFVTNVALVSAADCEPPTRAGISVRLGSPNDAEALARLVHGRESLAWRFARGDVVLVAEVDGHVAGCTWLTNQPMRPSYFPIKVEPKPGQWYNYGLVLLPEFRRRGLGRALSRTAMTEVKRRGGEVVFGHARRFDRVAAASHAAAGFVTVEEMLGLKLLNRFVVVLYRRRRTQLGEPNARR